MVSNVVVNDGMYAMKSRISLGGLNERSSSSANHAHGDFPGFLAELH